MERFENLKICIEKNQTSQKHLTVNLEKRYITFGQIGRREMSAGAAIGHREFLLCNFSFSTVPSRNFPLRTGSNLERRKVKE